MTCYSPSRHYLTAGLAAAALAVFSGWVATEWLVASIAATLFLATAILFIFLALQPRIEIYEQHLVIGRKIIPWSDIERLDRTSWVYPMIVHLTLSGDRHLIVVYPGDMDAAKSLLRHLRRCARQALIDGVPYREFWGEVLPGGVERKQLTAPRYQLLRPDDEAEVERLFQRLKTVGHLEPKNSSDENS